MDLDRGIDRPHPEREPRDERVDRDSVGIFVRAPPPPPLHRPALHPDADALIFVEPVLLFITELVSTRVGAFFGADVIVSAVALIGFVFTDGRRAGMKSLWAPVVGTLCVGVSLGLPLFLYLRERTRARVR